MLGCDIIEVGRVRKSYLQFGVKFLERVLSAQEKKIFYDRNENIFFLAGRFAAKEAVSKAFGTGITEGLNFKDISIIPDENGAPVVYIHESLTDIAVSISHCKEYAVAVCLKN